MAALKQGPFLALGNKGRDPARSCSRVLAAPWRKPHGAFVPGAGTAMAAPAVAVAFPGWEWHSQGSQGTVGMHTEVSSLVQGRQQTLTTQLGNQGNVQLLCTFDSSNTKNGR